MLLQKFQYESESYKETHHTQAEQSYLRGKKKWTARKEGRQIDEEKK